MGMTACAWAVGGVTGNGLQQHTISGCREKRDREIGGGQ